MDSSKTATSVMFACSAAGDLLPVYIVYKADHIWSTWTGNGLPGARYNRSRSGWFDGNIFEYWFMNIILPYFRSVPPGPKVLIGDNLVSHISINVIHKYEENEIRFVLLPLNSTHLTQPLDVSVIRPIEAAWKRTLRQWKKNNRGVIRKDVFLRLLNRALNSVETTNEKNIKSGFEATGIYPQDGNKVLNKLPTTEAQILQQEGHMARS
ncbi:hypothetical protein NQ315_012562 [Exocentrus adspersus]|uniref:DDE-1 domain-containing protein n=1 Tax=Exocentrus adspersus TaxID=1586481 RepID=A0AAV8VCS8_9CUCU|nr:hypothetical protein NQ315_012562 [Exocentrus adspersus]